MSTHEHDHDEPGHDHASHEHEGEHERDHEHADAHSHDDHDHASGEHEHEHEAPYEEQILDFRRGKDDFFRSSHTSPIPHEQRHQYAGLQYFPPDERYRIDGLTLEPEPDPTATTEVVTSDGKTREAWRVGTLDFAVPGGRAKLAGYTFEPGPVSELFIPFRDATSGSETYGAGRYLDLEPEEDGTYALDFNLAYNPWCAYAPQYSCPLPPPENWLKFPIPAGEKNPLEG